MNGINHYAKLVKHTDGNFNDSVISLMQITL